MRSDRMDTTEGLTFLATSTKAFPRSFATARGWDGFSAALRFGGAINARIVTAQRRDNPLVLHGFLLIFLTSIDFVLKAIARRKRQVFSAWTYFENAQP
jgi:hypothetical protein